MRSKVSFFSCLLPVCCVFLFHHCMFSFSFCAFLTFVFIHFNFILFSFYLQKKPARRRYENYGMYSDDDANSDASSACSERSYSSRNGGAIPTYMRQTEDVAEVSNNSSTASINKSMCHCSTVFVLPPMTFRKYDTTIHTADHILHILYISGTNFVTSLNISNLKQLFSSQQIFRIC